MTARFQNAVARALRKHGADSLLLALLSDLCLDAMSHWSLSTSVPLSGLFASVWLIIHSFLCSWGVGGLKCVQ